MERRKPNNYHWTECDISGWCSEKIKKELESRGYVVHGMDVMVKLCQRMNSLGLVYMISFDCGKDGKKHGIRNFCSITEETDGMEDFEWFLEFFKEMEMEAVLKFGSNVLDVEREVERKHCDVKSIDAPEMKTTDVSYATSINCTMDEIREFICKEEFVSMWSGNRAMFDGGEMKLDNVIMQDLKEKDGTITMRWKFREWSESSNVRITFEPLVESIKVVVNQRNVPIKEAQSVKMWWNERMFVPISACFGFNLKSI